MLGVLWLYAGKTFDAVKVCVEANNLREAQVLHQDSVVGISKGQVTFHKEGKDLGISAFARKHYPRQFNKR